MVWFVAFIFLVFDAPENHPRISPDEQQYIERSIAEQYTGEEVHFIALFYKICMEYFIDTD